MKIQVREFTAKEQKQAELDIAIENYKEVRQYLRQWAWNATAEGHNYNYPHKDCTACDYVIEVYGALKNER